MLESCSVDSLPRGMPLLDCLRSDLAVLDLPALQVLAFARLRDPYEVRLFSLRFVCNGSEPIRDVRIGCTDHRRRGHFRGPILLRVSVGLESWVRGE